MREVSIRSHCKNGKRKCRVSFNECCATALGNAYYASNDFCIYSFCTGFHFERVRIYATAIEWEDIHGFVPDGMKKGAKIKKKNGKRK